MRFHPSKARRRSAPPTFDAAGYAAAYPDIAKLLGSDPDRLHDHWAEWGHLENRTPFGLAPYRSRRFGSGFWRRAASIRMFGFFDAASGIGAAARAYLAALRLAGFRVTPITIEEQGSRFETRPDIRPRPAGLLRRPRLPAEARASRVNIFALNADMTHRFMLDGRTALLDDSYNIGIWFWELAYFPPGWAAAFGAFDEIWVASEFCREALQVVSLVPVVKVPMPVLPEEDRGEHLPRAHFGLPDDAFLFGCVFDVGSLVRRKNAIGAVEAFLSGFGGRTDAILVLKYHGTRHYPDSVAPFLRAAAEHANIRLIDRTFDAREAASFRAALDCLVSPHRSEGFGLNIAEAMAIGTPVVATGYSGNTDFMGPDDSLPVAYRLEEVGDGAWPYPATALWAEPDPIDLAARMREAFDDRVSTRRLAARGAARIAAAQSPEAAAPVLRARLDPVLGRDRRDGPPPSWGASREARTRYVDDGEPPIGVFAATTSLDGGRLAALVQRLAAQTHLNWELILQDEPGTPDPVRRALVELRGRDPRIKVSVGAAEKTIEDVLAMTSARLVIVADAAFAPAPGALAECARPIRRHPDATSEAPSRDAFVLVRRDLLLGPDAKQHYGFAGLARLAESVRERAGAQPAATRP